MPMRVARAGVSRRPTKAKTGNAHRLPADQGRGPAGEIANTDDWVEPDNDSERLAEGEMEILLTGHAATHGIEGEDNWLIESEKQSFGER